MAQEVVKTAKTVDEAIQSALEEFGCGRDAIGYEVLTEPAKGLFGLLGSRDAKVRVWITETARESADSGEAAFALNSAARAGAAAEIKPSIKAGGRESAREGARESASPDSDDKTSQFILDVTKLMGIEADVVKKESEESILYTLNGPKMGTVIGRRGETLDAIQYLSNIVAGRDRAANRKRIIVDAEDYRQRREDTLVRLASRLATRAKRSGRRVVLEPMNPQERRIIHTAIEKDPDVKSLSEGEEPYRRLVIYPAESFARDSAKYDRNDRTDRPDRSDRTDRRTGSNRDTWKSPYSWGKDSEDNSDDDDDE